MHIFSIFFKMYVCVGSGGSGVYKMNEVELRHVGQRESAGGFHNASAYCLIYVDDNNAQLRQGDDGSK